MHNSDDENMVLFMLENNPERKCFYKTTSDIWRY